jgi:hypothetical protein
MARNLMMRQCRGIPLVLITLLILSCSKRPDSVGTDGVSPMTPAAIAPNSL